MAPAWPKKPRVLPNGKYVYRIDVDSVPRYVGAGSGLRAWDHFDLAERGSEVPFHKFLATRAVSSEVRVVVLRQNLSEAEAHVLERKLIESYGRVLLQTGPLLNVADGSRYNGQRMHTARAEFVSGMPDSFDVKRVSKRRRPTKFTREYQKIAYRSAFGSKS